jgi:NTP pyrophosphatase (non-canonical NTP hydrolase)
MKKVPTENKHLLHLFSSSPNMEIQKEVQRAVSKHPNWDEDLRVRANIITEESGELSKACNEFYEARTEEEADAKLNEIKKEAVQTIATLMRFVSHLDLDPIALPNHLQPELEPMDEEQTLELTSFMDVVANGKIPAEVAISQFESILNDSRRPSKPRCQCADGANYGYRCPTCNPPA